MRIEKLVNKYPAYQTYALMRFNGKQGKPKPHGRVAYVIITGPSSYIDLSVMPRSSSAR